MTFSGFLDHLVNYLVHCLKAFLKVFLEAPVLVQSQIVRQMNLQLIAGDGNLHKRADTFSNEELHLIADCLYLVYVNNLVAVHEPQQDHSP